MENGFSAFRFGLLIATFICLASSSGASDLSPIYVRGELIVKLKSRSPMVRDVRSSLLKKLGLGSIRALRRLGSTEFHHIKLVNPNNFLKAADELRKHPEVDYVEPNYIYKATNFPNDPDFSKQWGLRNFGQVDDYKSNQSGLAGADIDVERVWAQGWTGGHQVLVAVIDTGVRWDHPDLVENIYKNPGEIPENGLDDDGNGLIDDVRGWNFSENNNDPMDDSDSGHGTHCAGVIGASANNGIGGVGVNWNVSILPIKFLSQKGFGTTVDAIRSVQYAMDMGADVISNSWGGGGASQAMFDLLEEAEEKGIVVVAAAGNDRKNHDLSPDYPSGYPVSNIISVAASDNLDRPANFTNYGEKSVDVAAPGQAIYSTIPDGYGMMSGTSMATPMVAGAAALLKSVYPDWTHHEIKRRLILTSDPVPSWRKMNIAKGRINVFNAMNGIVPPRPGTPDESLWTDVPYALESVHPYFNDDEAIYRVRHRNARLMRVHFKRIDVEQMWDQLYVEGIRSDGSIEYIEMITGKHQNYMSNFFEGNEIRLRLVSDRTETAWGFKVDRIQVIY